MSQVSFTAGRFSVLRSKRKLQEERDLYYNTLSHKKKSIEKSTRKVLRKSLKRLDRLMKYGHNFTQLPAPTINLIKLISKLVVEGNIEHGRGLMSKLNPWIRRLKGVDAQFELGEMVESSLLEMMTVVSEAYSNIGVLEEEFKVWDDRTTFREESKLRWVLELDEVWKDDVFSVWYACSIGDFDLLDKILQFEHSDQKRFRTVHSLIQSDISNLLTSPDPDFGRTPLHYAVKHNQITMVQYLLQRQVDVNCQDNQVTVQR